MYPRTLAFVLVAGYSLGWGQETVVGDSLWLSEEEIVEILPPERTVVPEPPPRPARENERYPYSFTVSPLHVAGLLSLEVMLERMLTPQASLALIGGAGTIFTGFGLTGGPGLDLHEIGAQVRYYPREQGRWNPHLGLEGFWGRAFLRSQPEEEDDWFSTIFDGEYLALGGGGFFGTKFVNLDGVTLEVQGGYQLVRVHRHGGAASYLLFPIINLNVGQSF